MTAPTTPSRKRLGLSDLARLSTVGLRTRKLRAGVSALGIAVGVPAIVAVLGLSASAQAGLLNEINQLGTNLLTVSNRQNLTGGTTELPTTAPAMIGRISGVQQAQTTGTVNGANAYRNPYVPVGDTNALTVQTASLDLLPVVATGVAEGHYLNAATAQEPVAVLGAAAAQRLGIDRIYPPERIWVGGQWFYVAGILQPAVLVSAIDSSVLVGYPAAQKYLGFDGHPSTMYLRAQDVLLGLLGGAVGVGSTVVYADTKGWAAVVPTVAWAGGIAASVIIGAVAGLMPALRAARLSPTQALWSV